MLLRKYGHGRAADATRGLALLLAGVALVNLGSRLGRRGAQDGLPGEILGASAHDVALGATLAGGILVGVSLVVNVAALRRRGKGE